PRPVFQFLKPAYRWLSGLAGQPGGPLAAPAGPDAPPGAGYAVVCFPIITWEFRFQRPQQLLTRLARAGHRIYYLRTNFAGPAAEPLQALAPGVFGLRLPGPSNLSIYTGVPTPAQVEAWLAA